MPRKGKTGEQASSSAVPDYVQQSRVYQRRRVTKRKLPSFTEAMLLLHAPETLRLFWKAINEGLAKRDKVALEMTGEMFSYVRGKGINLNLTQQMLQQNHAAGPESPVIGTDAFLRQLAEARAGRALPPPPEVIDVDVRPADSVESAPAGD